MLTQVPTPGEAGRRRARHRGGRAASRAEASARRTTVAAAAAMSCTETHSRGEWNSWPPVKRFGVGRPFALRTEPSVPPRIGCATTRCPRRDRLLGRRRRPPGTASRYARMFGYCGRRTVDERAAARRGDPLGGRASRATCCGEQLVVEVADDQRAASRVPDAPAARTRWRNPSRPDGRLRRERRSERRERSAAATGGVDELARRRSRGGCRRPRSSTITSARRERLVLQLAERRRRRACRRSTRRSARCRTASRPRRSPRPG